MNEYKLIREDGRQESRFEYAVETEGMKYMRGSLAMAGIGIVEKYVSLILDRKVEFFLIQCSRLFSGISSLKQNGLVLDLAISEMDNDVYQVSAELTDRKNVLAELCGRMSPSKTEEESAGYPRPES